MASPEDKTPVIEEVRADVGGLSLSETLPHSEPLSAVNIPSCEAREEDMAQSYHEIFDSQGYRAASRGESSSSLDTPGGSVETVQVFYSEGEGRLVSVSPPGCQPPMSQYLTRKLISDTLMWQETFRNDSPSPEDKVTEASDLDRPVSQVSDLSPVRRGGEVVLDPRLINDIEREARRLATELDSLVETLSCALQSISGLTVEHVQTYRDGVCKTCDQVDTNIRAMYQLMAKWEELNKNMAPAYKVSSQIKDIKRLLDLFEGALG